MQSETETRKYWSTPVTTPALRAELDLSPDGKRVLEIGTAAGHLTRAVVSIPNIAHGSVRLSLMEGRFAYTPCGLLDATHLRFFTLASSIGLFNDNGLEILALRRIRKGFFDSEIPLVVSRIQPSLVARLVEDSEATSYQFVFRATPSG